MICLCEKQLSPRVAPKLSADEFLQTGDRRGRSEDALRVKDFDFRSLQDPFVSNGNPEHTTMGQKIHPLGFRVGITKRHQTVWFARFQKRQYAQTVLEDIFIRKTVENLLPELLKKKSNSADQTPKIAQIKIERGFIPYEIGIQIHAQNCDVIKTAIDRLEVDAEVFKTVLKNGFVFEQASNAYEVGSAREGDAAPKSASKAESQTATIAERSDRRGRGMRKKGISNRFAEKRFGKRKNALERFRRRILENMLIIKTGKTLRRKFQKPEALRTNSKKGKGSARFSKGSSGFEQGGSRQTSSGDLSKVSQARLRALLTDDRDRSQRTTKFMNVFLSKTNRAFLSALKTDLAHWNSYLDEYKADQLRKFGGLREAPLGYQSKWSLSRLKRYEKKPLSALIKVLKMLQKQALQKLEVLRKEFFALGQISKMRSFSYYQRIRFIKALKEFIQQTQSAAATRQNASKNNASTDLRRFELGTNENRIEKEKRLAGLTGRALKQKFTNLKNETRKVKFVEHLQSLIRRHREKNLYLYLATISDSRKYLREIQKFTKQQATFLFGLTDDTLKAMDEGQRREFIKAQLKKTFKKAHAQQPEAHNLQDVFLRQINQQRLICQQNLALAPKLSLKFYNVPAESIETNASVVTDGIVDKLEKREAFRKVIKKVSEDLMKTNKVKGVKIQVSGRLNGAEIARSEWVRAGRVPLQTLRANIDYCYKTAQTIYGIIGVKVWIYRGYTKRNKNA